MATTTNTALLVPPSTDLPTLPPINNAKIKRAVCTHSSAVAVVQVFEETRLDYEKLEHVGDSLLGEQAVFLPSL
jgi:dsRNA-specific ribonuclease